MPHLKPQDQFPDFTLPNQDNKPRTLSSFTAAPIIDQRLGFKDGYPLILVFGRGFFCPRDQQQMRMLVQFYDELAVNFCKLITISTDPPKVQAAFRAGLGAKWPFLSDEKRELINKIDILDETEGEYAFTARPFTFVLHPDLKIHKIYDGWYFVGRPTIQELRIDLREIMSQLSYYSYDAFNTEHVKSIRIPQQQWHQKHDAGKNSGRVSWFDLRTGNGMIRGDDEKEYFFNFTAIPGEGYRTINAGTEVHFDIVESKTGLSAMNVTKRPD